MGQVHRPVRVREDARVTRTRADVARTALDVPTKQGSDALTHARVVDVAGYSEGQRPIRAILAESFDGPELEAAISMVSGVVACPALMFGTVPDDDVIEAAVDIVMNSAVLKSAG